MINKKFDYEFSYSMIKPKYWLTWFLIILALLLSKIPAKLRDPILCALAYCGSNLSNKGRRRAEINLKLCMPLLTHTQRVKIINKMYVTGLQSLINLAELAYNQEKFKKRVIWHDKDIITNLRDTQQNILFIIPHGVSIDLPAMLLASEGYKIAIIIKKQKNEVVNYFWNYLRSRFGGRIHVRENGIKPFLNSLRDGYYGYYLPDQDHGEKQSLFVDFFSTYKATVPAIGKIMRICNVRSVPLFPVYDSKNHQLHIFVKPPMDDLLNADELTQARRMNEVVEYFINRHPEQYNWTLKFLKTRKNGEKEPYGYSKIHAHNEKYHDK